MKLAPLNDFVLLELIPDADVTQGGIVLPTQRRRDSLLIRGRVLEAGPGEVLENGDRSLVSVMAGDRVLFPAGHGESFEDDGRKLVMIRAAEIVAKIE